MKFIEFVNDQIARLEAIPGFQMGDGGRKELASWLIEKANVNGKAIVIPTSPQVQNIYAVISECVEFSTPPGLSDIKAVWYRLYPPVISHERCEHCNGTGYRIVKRGGVEGAARCSGYGIASAE